MLLELFEFMPRYLSPSHTLPCSLVLHRHTLFYALFNDSRRLASAYTVTPFLIHFFRQYRSPPSKLGKSGNDYWVTGQSVACCILLILVSGLGLTDADDAELIALELKCHGTLIHLLFLLQRAISVTCLLINKRYSSAYWLLAIFLPSTIPLFLT